jgi:hypothetical protein
LPSRLTSTVIAKHRQGIRLKPSFARALEASQRPINSWSALADRAQAISTAPTAVALPGAV